MSKEKRLTYEPPRAMRLNEQPLAAGDCMPSGSGDAWCQDLGNAATTVCYRSGNSAAGANECIEPGNSAVGACEATGNGVYQ